MAAISPLHIEALRTPEECFKALPNFPYQPKYVKYGNLQMAYIDEDNQAAQSNEAEVFLCIHGQPTWSFLYRRMIPLLLHHTTRSQPPARRVIAPDLIGFGRSDKPVKDEVYTYNFHRDALVNLIQVLDLRNITLVVQDWGGILGLTLPVIDQSRFKRLIIMNTSLPTGEAAGKGFNDWRGFSNRSPDMKIGQLIGRGAQHLTQAELQAYDAPFPNKQYKAGVRRFPNLVMTEPNMEGIDVVKKAKKMYKDSDALRAEDVFIAVGMKDPVLGPPVMRDLAKVFKNGCFWMEVAEGGHFVQEWGEEIAKKAIEAFETQNTPKGVSRIHARGASKL